MATPTAIITAELRYLRLDLRITPAVKNGAERCVSKLMDPLLRTRSSKIFADLVKGLDSAELMPNHVPAAYAVDKPSQ
jgi:hypothetical protein